MRLAFPLPGSCGLAALAVILQLNSTLAHPLDSHNQHMRNGRAIDQLQPREAAVEASSKCSETDVFKTWERISGNAMGFPNVDLPEKYREDNGYLGTFTDPEVNQQVGGYDWYEQLCREQCETAFGGCLSYIYHEDTSSCDFYSKRVGFSGIVMGAEEAPCSAFRIVADMKYGVIVVYKLCMSRAVAQPYPRPVQYGSGSVMFARQIALCAFVSPRACGWVRFSA